MSREAASREVILATCALMLVTGPVAAAWNSDTAPSTRDQARESRSLKAVCARCHNLQMVMDTPMSYDAWHDTVQTMMDRGATGTDQQFADVMDYLHRTMTTIDVNTADADDLQIVLHVPEAAAQAILARRSTQKFISLADLESVPGVDASTLEAKARLIFFK
ncbi:MAG: helix-hairpin-helix domain-containing protein [Acidobacteriaceae bacterium]